MKKLSISEMKALTGGRVEIEGLDVGMFQELGSINNPVAGDPVTTRP